MKTFRALFVLGAALMAVASFATTWVFDYSPTAGEQNSSAGFINQVVTTYNDATQRLTFQANFAAQTDGFWLAINNGPNPKGHAGELAIAYFDAFGPSGPAMTVYGYNGVNGNNSYYDGDAGTGGNQTPDKILASEADDSWVNSFTFINEGNGTRTLGFDIDASLINGHSPLYPHATNPWTGMQFDDMIGMWFHPVNQLTTAYGADGYLTNFSAGQTGWFDFSDKEAVPEPMTMGVLAALAALKRRKAKKKAAAA